MANIEAFRGIRYDLGHVGALSDVIAPPYDVIDSALQDALYEQHPANIIRLILNRDEPGDSDPDQRYQRAAKYLKQWQKEGVLFTTRALKMPESLTRDGGSCRECVWNRSGKEPFTHTSRPMQRPRPIDSS